MIYQTFKWTLISVIFVVCATGPFNATIARANTAQDSAGSDVPSADSESTTTGDAPTSAVETSPESQSLLSRIFASPYGIPGLIALFLAISAFVYAALKFHEQHVGNA